MKVLARTNKKSQFLYKNALYHFRDDVITLPNDQRSVLYLSTQTNKWVHFSLISEQLIAGTHKFQLQTFDDLGNNSDLIEGSIAIVNYTTPPRFPTYVYLDRHHIKLRWIAPAAGNPTNYVVYSNNGSGAIDTTSHFDVLAGTATEVSYNLPSNGTWKFRIEAYKNGVESNTNFEVWTVIPRENQTPPQAFNENRQIDIALSAQNVNAGRLKVEFIWIYGSLASHFRIYHDSGTGTINYGSYIEFARQNGIFQTYTTNQIYFGKDNQTFTFVLRAVNEYGNIDANEIEHTVQLDGVSPEDVTGLTMGSTL